MAIVIFDMDGTLADNEVMTVKAAADGLRAYYEQIGAPPVIPNPETVRSLVGLPALEYFGGLLPPDRKEDARTAMRFVQQCEVDRLRAGEGRLYPGAGTVLKGLRRDGWRIGLVSNCMRGYFDANLEYVLRRDWFEIALCLDDEATKTANVRRAVNNLGGGPGAMVGDRGSDLEAGEECGLETIGCLYGYGRPEELERAGATVRSVREIPGALHRLRKWKRI